MSHSYKPGLSPEGPADPVLENPSDPSGCFPDPSTGPVKVLVLLFLVLDPASSGSPVGFCSSAGPCGGPLCVEDIQSQNRTGSVGGSGPGPGSDGSAGERPPSSQLVLGTAGINPHSEVSELDLNWAGDL